MDLNSLDAILTETDKDTSVGDLHRRIGLSLGCCTPTKLPTPKSWNVDILFETIKQLAPGTTWRRVIENLDHEGFDIPNMEAFLFFHDDCQKNLQGEIFKEQVTRVLLERLTMKRPHPWGLVFTVTELTKNPRYRFREQRFIRSAPGIEKVFESVASSCGVRVDN
ncbi:hypothetical protein Bca101_019268 [Brassica carinata]